MNEHRRQRIKDVFVIGTVGLIFTAVALLSIQPPPTATRLPTRTPTATPTITATPTQTQTPTATPTNYINETRFTVNINGKRGVFVYGNYFVFSPACVYGGVASAVIVTQDGKIINQDSYVTGVRVKGSTDLFQMCPYPATNFYPSTATP